MILLIDNYDSFVFNLARYLRRLGQPTHVVRNDVIDAAGVRALAPDAVVISPGPGTPNEAGCCLELVRQLSGDLPLLGVCLGHQAIAAALGGRVVRAAEPMHGRTSEVFHDGREEFTDLSDPMTVGRYHSLVVSADGLPECLQVSARAADGTIMAFRHREYPVIGWQFHPESILTDYGYELLAGFLRHAGLPVPSELPTASSERAISEEGSYRRPSVPIPY